jgi:hypothetical protein
MPELAAEAGGRPATSGQLRGRAIPEALADSGPGDAEATRSALLAWHRHAGAAH